MTDAEKEVLESALKDFNPAKPNTRECRACGSLVSVGKRNVGTDERFSWCPACAPGCDWRYGEVVEESEVALAMRGLGVDTQACAAKSPAVATRASLEPTAWNISLSLERIAAGLAEPDVEHPADPVDGDLAYFRRLSVIEAECFQAGSWVVVARHESQQQRLEAVEGLVVP